MDKIALVDNQGQPFPSHEREPLNGYGLQPVDTYRLAETDLTPYAGLIIGGASDQEFLYRNRHIVEDFLSGGRVVAFSGHLLRPWLPGCGTFIPKQIRSFKDYTVHLTGNHPIFAGVDPQELTFRRGVAGFFSRGHHPPPEGVEVLAHLGPDEPIVYVDRVTTPGVILAHCGNDLLGFGDGGTADRIVPQLLDWIREQGRLK